MEGRLGIAVSGGPDSMALLHMAASVAPGRTEAATVDHGLRAESAEEARMVARWCGQQGILHATLSPTERIKGSIQREARAARYGLLDGWMEERRLDWLLTAHHADDQLETMMMRLNRSSGIAGLAGVRARRGKLIRPLLNIRKSELDAYVRELAIPHVIDPSNVDDRFDRARFRKALSDAEWLDPLAAARSAAALADAEEAIEWSLNRLAAEHISQEGDVLVLKPDGLPREYLRRLLAFMLRLVAPEAPLPRGEQIDQAIVQLSDGRKLSIGTCLATGGAVWRVWPAPPRRNG